MNHNEKAELLAVIEELRKVKDAALHSIETAMFAIQILEDRNAYLQEEIERLKQQH